MGLSGDDWMRRLANEVAGRVLANHVRVDAPERLTGGAIQENVALTISIDGGPLTGSHDVVVRTEARTRVPESRPIARQFLLLKAAYDAGVIVPEPLWLFEAGVVTDTPMFVMRRVGGEALGPRIVRGAPHPELVRELGRNLARIHAISSTVLRTGDPNIAIGAASEDPGDDPVAAAIGKYRAYLDDEPVPHPVLEWGLRWIETHKPQRHGVVLVHRDFRTGNYMVENGRLTAILDWEFAGLGDPMEDVAWFCAKCWRFGSNVLEAGGIADRETFYTAYEAESGRAIDRAAIRAWEIMAHVRWAIIALHQAARWRKETADALELALIGRRLPELEHEILTLTGVL